MSVTKRSDLNRELNVLEFDANMQTIINNETRLNLMSITIGANRFNLFKKIGNATPKSLQEGDIITGWNQDLALFGSWQYTNTLADNDITNFTDNYEELWNTDHTHVIADVTGLQTALNLKLNSSDIYAWAKAPVKPSYTYSEVGAEQAFTKNTAFNKNFGSIAGTVAQGNDSRIINGQSAYSWGNHASAGYELLSHKNVANGYVGLDASSKINPSQLPALAITETFVVSSQSAMLALSGAGTGDIAIRTDLHKSYILQGTNYAVLSDWAELLSPLSAVSSVFGRTGAITAQAGDYTTSQVSEGSNLYYTNARVKSYADTLYSALGHTHTFASLTSKPTTLAGYGITDAITGTGTAGYIPKFSGISALANSPIYTDGTNVGIGTNNPNMILHVNGNTLFGIPPTSSYFNIAPLNLSNNATGVLKTQLNLINGGGSIGAGSSIDFYTYTNQSTSSGPGARFGVVDDGNYSGHFIFITKDTSPRSPSSPITERFRITSTGNVGIGIPTPTQKLDVAGNIKSTGQLISTVATGTAPLSVASTTLVTNLNADLLGGRKDYYNPTNSNLSTVDWAAKNLTASVIINGKPTTYWDSTSSDFYGFQSRGQISSEGGFGLHITSNGYRNESGTWTSYAINGNTGASQIQLLPNGEIKFRGDASKANGSSMYPTDRLTITTSGDLVASGNITATGEITAYSTSDKRLKSNVIKLQNATAILNKINVVSFNWNDKAKKLNGTKDDRLNYGVIAQELAKTNAELIHPIYNKYLGVDYLGFVPILIQANKEVVSEIDRLKSRIKYLEEKCL